MSKISMVMFDLSGTTVYDDTGVRDCLYKAAQEFDLDTTRSATRMSRSLMSASDIIFPARTKKGIANKIKESNDRNNLTTTMSKGRSTPI